MNTPSQPTMIEPNVSASQQDLRYRLEIVVPSVVDVVESAGGWIFDRVMAGWRVLALVGEHIDDRPLRILGAEPLSVDTALSSERLCGYPASLAVPTELFECDPHVREWVLKALGHGLTQVVLWGRRCPPGFGNMVDFRQHRLTTAAQLFKGQALVAAGVADRPVGNTEKFHTPASARPLLAPDFSAVRVQLAPGEFGMEWRRVLEVDAAGALT